MLMECSISLMGNTVEMAGGDIWSQSSENRTKSGCVCTDFKWTGFAISDPIQNPDHLQTAQKQVWFWDVSDILVVLLCCASVEKE